MTITNGSPLFGPHHQVNGAPKMPSPVTNNFTTAATAGSGSAEKSDSSPPKSGAGTPLAVITSRQHRSGSSQPPSPAAPTEPHTPTAAAGAATGMPAAYVTPSRKKRVVRTTTASSFGGGAQAPVTPSQLGQFSFLSPPKAAGSPAAAAAATAITAVEATARANAYNADDKSPEPEPALAVMDVADSERPAPPPVGSPAAPGGPSTTPAAKPKAAEGQTTSPSSVAVEMAVLNINPKTDEKAVSTDNETAEQMMKRLEQELAAPSSAPQPSSLKAGGPADESFVPLCERGGKFWFTQIVLFALTLASGAGLSYYVATDKELENSAAIVSLGNTTTHLLRMFFANLGRVTPNGRKLHRVGDHLVQHHIFTNVIGGGLLIQSLFKGYFTRDQWLFSYILYALTFGWNLNANLHNIYSRVTQFNAAEARLTSLDNQRRASDLSTDVTRQRHTSPAVNYHLPKINIEHPTWQQRWQALKEDRTYLGELVATGITGLGLFFVGRNLIPPAVLFNIVAAFVADLGLVLTGYPVGRATERVVSPEDPHRPMINAAIRILFFLGIDSSLNGALGIFRLLILGTLLGYYGAATATTRRAYHQRLEHTIELFRQYYPQHAGSNEPNVDPKATENLTAMMGLMKQNVDQWLATPTNNIVDNQDHRPIGRTANRGLHAFIATVLLGSGLAAALRKDWATLITNTVAGIFAVSTYHLLKDNELNIFEDFRLRNVKLGFKDTMRYWYTYTFRHNPMTTLSVPYDWLVGSWDRTIGSDNPAERTFGLHWVNGVLVVSTCTQAGGAYSYTYMQPHPSSSELFELHRFITNPREASLQFNIHTQRCFIELLKSHFPASSITAAIKAKVTMFQEMEKMRTSAGGVPHNPDLLKQAGMGGTAGTDSARGLGISRRAGPRYIPAPS